MKIITHSDEYQRDNKLAWWGTWGPACYALLRSAHESYTIAQNYADSLRTPYHLRIRTTRSAEIAQQIADSHYMAFVHLAYALRGIKD